VGACFWPKVQQVLQINEHVTRLLLLLLMLMARETGRKTDRLRGRESRLPLVYYHVIDSTVVRQRSCGFNVLHLMTRLKATPTPINTSNTSNTSNSSNNSNNSVDSASKSKRFVCRQFVCLSVRQSVSLSVCQSGVIKVIGCLHSGPLIKQLSGKRFGINLRNRTLQCFISDELSSGKFKCDWFSG